MTRYSNNSNSFNITWNTIANMESNNSNSNSNSTGTAAEFAVTELNKFQYLTVRAVSMNSYKQPDLPPLVLYTNKHFEFSHCPA